MINIKIAEDGSPIAWGEQLAGTLELPDPPDGGPVGYRWDSDTEEWVDDDVDHQPTVTVRRTAISSGTKDEYRETDSVEEKCDLLFEILTGEEP